MALINLASGASAWRGYDDYKNKKVKNIKETGDGTFEGQVLGSDESVYHVAINPQHPRSSKCNCPHADGKRTICKHMIALYFAAFPEAAKDYHNEVIKAQEEEEVRQEKMENALISHVSKMKKSELQQALLQLIFDGPEWQYDRFLRENIEEYWD